MKRRSSFILFLTLLLSSPIATLAQGESGVPFLLISPNPAANGWGQISTAVVSDNPMASISNPGQLGLFSLENYFSAGTYVPKTQWLPNFLQSDLTYNVSAVNVGVNLAREFDFDLPISLGMGYSRVYLDLGMFIRTGPGGPEPIGTFHAYEKAEAFSVALGIDYYVKLGVGMSFDNILSSLSPIGTEQEPGSGKANVSATDFGLVLDVPIIDIMGKANGERIVMAYNLSPLVNISAGYAHRYHGNRVTYLDAAQSDPLPRNVTIGISTELGLVMGVDDQPWKLLTFAIAREAEDLLVLRKPGGAFEYQSGLGDISFFKHVIQGKLADNERPTLHKGWQLNFGEVIYVRGGSFAESPNFGNRNFTTSGFGIRLGGFFKLLAAVDSTALSGDVLSFLSNHFDLVYDHAEYVDDGPLGGTKFNALSIVIK